MGFECLVAEYPVRWEASRFFIRDRGLNSCGVRGVGGVNHPGPVAGLGPLPECRHRPIGGFESALVRDDIPLPIENPQVSAHPDSCGHWSAQRLQLGGSWSGGPWRTECIDGDDLASGRDPSNTPNGILAGLAERNP